MYKDILTLINPIYSLVQALTCWFKEYTNTMTVKAGFKQFNTYLCLLYRVNELGTAIIMVYVYDTLEIKDKPELIDTIEFIKK